MVNIRNLRPLEADALHGFQVLGDPVFRDIFIDPMPPSPGPRIVRGSGEAGFQRGGFGIRGVFFSGLRRGAEAERDGGEKAEKWNVGDVEFIHWPVEDEGRRSLRGVASSDS